MAYRLKNRQKQIPNGYTYKQPETKWKPSRFPSFDTLVAQVVAHRLGNAELAQKYATDPVAVANEMDEYNASVCARNGWLAYIDIPGGGPPPPKSPASLAEGQRQVSAAAGRVKKIWAGVRTLDDWLDSGEAPVPAAVSAQRAAVCAACHLNGQGDFTTWFTKPAAEAIKRQIEKASALLLTTPSDAKINVCEACLCPLKLKVHTPLKFIVPHLTAAVRQELLNGDNCWIIAETK